MAGRSEKVTFSGGMGEPLAARLDWPDGSPRAFALFAHCFSCSKDIHAAARIAAGLSARGIAVLRFDFTGLGNSEGDFANTNFSSNIDDLAAAADWLRATHEAPSLLIGHSLGGAAVIMAAARVPEAKAVVTLAAPSDVEHVQENFAAHLEEIQETGAARVTLGGRPFTIRKQFLDDLKRHQVTEAATSLHKALLVMHAPRDAQVSIDHATKIFGPAKHPKSFVSLDEADHLISRKEDAAYAAEVIAAWAGRYLALSPPARPVAIQPPQTVRVEETGARDFSNAASAGAHILYGDQPPGTGRDTGASPYEFVAMGLGLCTNQTLRMYANRKKLAVDKVVTTVVHEKRHCDDCAGAVEGKPVKVSNFSREIELHGDLDDEARRRLMEIADMCPVHKMLADHQVAVETRLKT
jgi:putative redox protein